MIDGVRFVGTTLWSDFDALASRETDLARQLALRGKAFRAANYYLSKNTTLKDGAPALAEELREMSLDCQAWLRAALAQARDARLAILDLINQAIDGPDEMSPNAPRIITVKVPVDKIGEVIGPKGKMINQIQDDTGAQLTIEDDGTIYIGATDGAAATSERV